MKSPKKYLPAFLLIFIFILPLVCAAQENSTATKAQKKADKKKEKQEANKRKSELKGKKFHYQIQDKATRKRMKKHRRKVDHGYPSGKPGFFKRIFGKNQAYFNKELYQKTASSTVFLTHYQS